MILHRSVLNSLLSKESGWSIGKTLLRPLFFGRIYCTIKDWPSVVCCKQGAIWFGPLLWTLIKLPFSFCPVCLPFLFKSCLIGTASVVEAFKDGDGGHTLRPWDECEFEVIHFQFDKIDILTALGNQSKYALLLLAWVHLDFCCIKLLATILCNFYYSKV